MEVRLWNWGEFVICAPLEVGYGTMATGRSCVLLLVLLSPSVAAAQALESNPGSATALSLAGAGVTSVQDPAAIWINPANLVHSSARVAAGLGLETSGRSAFRVGPINQGSPEARDGAGVQLAPHVGVAVPLWDDRLWAGLGYHLELNHRSRYPVYPHADLPTPVAERTGPVRFIGTELQLQQHMISLGLAFRWSMLAVGGALELSHVRLAHRRTLWAGFKGDASQLEEHELNVDALVEASGLLDAGAVFGVWLRPVSFLELGLAARLPVRSRLEGSATLVAGVGAPRGYDSWTARGGDARLEVLLPLQVEGGFTLTWRSLRMFCQFSWRRWSAMDSPEALLEDAALVLTRASAAETWPVTRLPLGIQLQDHLALRAGLEWRLWSGFLTLRTGYAFHQGGTRGESPAPVLLDLNRHVWSLGAEVAVKTVRLGLAVQQSFEASLNATGQEARLHNPLDSAVTGPVGEGHYQADMTRVLMDVQIGW